MTEQTPETPDSCLSHVSLGANDYPRALAFYEAVLPTLGIVKIMEHPGAAAFGRAFPEFWIQSPHDDRPATVGNGTHIAFMALSRQQVHRFHEAAVAAGAAEDGPPGPRPLYGEPYYGCFVRDPEGNKIEATYWDMDKARELGMA
ncbi:VOC family protein [Fodinicurvata sp. EGI_FJ10296]|uniref:VOC family protein n=1 Tax=Fodinicurvata sp. EGI_FJ10296 TaxID=3231908 RepID=UPI00345652CC